MQDITIGEMQEMQRTLQQKYFEKWGGLSPQKGAEQLLWLYGELAEAADIIKKQGSDAIMQDAGTRRHFTEELCDALMYFNDVLLCYGIKPEDVSTIYREKFSTNMNRW